jgi:hypothetical protein
MKKLYSVIIVILTVTFTFANPVINSITANGNWKNSSTWNLSRVPADGDTVVIPTGKIVVIDNIQNLSTGFLYIKVYGVLKFSNGKLWLNDNSVVIIFNGGSITGTGNSSETLRIGIVEKFSSGIDGTLTISGFANKTTGTSPLGFNSSINILLPVKFVGFNVARQNNNVLVEWVTAEEMNSSYYEVQRSENGNDWNTIASIAASGTTTLTHSYSFTDRNIATKIVYYRIRQVDINGRFVITPVRMIKNENGGTEIKVNSSSSNSIYVHFSEQVKANVVIRLTSSNGQIVSQKTFGEPVGQVMVPVQNAIKGIYIVTVTDGQDLKFSKQILL